MAYQQQSWQNKMLSMNTSNLDVPGQIRPFLEELKMHKHKKR